MKWAGLPPSAVLELGSCVAPSETPIRRDIADWGSLKGQNVESWSDINVLGAVEDAML